MIPPRVSLGAFIQEAAAIYAGDSSPLLLKYSLMKILSMMIVLNLKKKNILLLKIMFMGLILIIRKLKSYLEIENILLL